MGKIWGNKNKYIILHAEKMRKYVKKRKGMDKITSKYNGKITSVDETLSHISSKTESNITSTTRFVLNSKVMSAPGASDIVSMRGAFSTCNVSDWKSAKANILRVDY